MAVVRGGSQLDTETVRLAMSLATGKEVSFVGNRQEPTRGVELVVFEVAGGDPKDVFICEEAIGRDCFPFV